jgi:hypothetical protein
VTGSGGIGNGAIWSGHRGQHPKLMKHRIPPKFHGPLCLLGFLAIIAITALIESIGGSR